MCGWLSPDAPWREVVALCPGCAMGLAKVKQVFVGF